MAEKKKSKTDVTARKANKTVNNVCRICGNKIEVVLSVSASGKKRMKRLCCEG